MRGKEGQGKGVGASSRLKTRIAFRGTRPSDHGYSRAALPSVTHPICCGKLGLWAVLQRKSPYAGGCEGHGIMCSWGEDAAAE